MQNDARWTDGDKGEFRTRQNFIGPHPRATIEESTFVPPPWEYVVDAIYNWETWMHNEKTAHVLVRAAVSHYQFETIHPFLDGNGRLGRLIALLLLLHDGKALSEPLLNISPYLEARREEYQDHLRAVSGTGNFDPWVCFFLEGIRTQATAAVEKISALRLVVQDMLETLRAKKVRGTAIRLAEDAIGFPIVAAPDVRDRYGVTYQAAAQALTIMVDSGLFTSVIIGANRKVYVCPAVMDLVTKL
jgi:Fic family protein